MSSQPPPKRIHVVVKLPYNRPTNAPRDPTPVEWSAANEQFLRNALSRSRSSDNAVIDWPSLAAQLNKPLPYLLFRAQARYEEDLRGLQDFRGALHLQLSNNQRPEEPQHLPDGDRHFSPVPRGLQSPWNVSAKTSGPGTPTPQRLPTPIAAAFRPNIGKDLLNPARPLSESTATLSNRPPITTKLRSSLTSDSPASSTSSLSNEDDEDDDEKGKVEEERLGERFKELEKMMSSNMLGFARHQQEPDAENPLSVPTTPGPLPQGLKGAVGPSVTPSPRGRNRQENQVGSPPGPLPSTSFPKQSISPGNIEGTSQVARVAENALSPPLIRGRMPLRANTSVSRARASESNHGSSASSFSDISDTSISASALEDALMSNIGKVGASRLSLFARSQFGGPRGSSRQ